MVPSGDKKPLSVPEAQIDLASEPDEDLDELSGKLGTQLLENKLMHSVLECDKDVIDDGKLIFDGVNQGLGGLVPDLMFEQMVRNFSLAKKLYGETIIRAYTGYSSDYMKKNIKIPEFKKKIKKIIDDRSLDLRQKKLLNSDNTFSELGLELASVVLYMEELDNIMPKGMLGEKIDKRKSHSGDKGLTRVFKKGDRYRDIAIRDSIKLAIRRGHENLDRSDLIVHERISKSSISIIYAIDASASMKGEKLSTAKKAGIGLAYMATNAKDKVGLIIFCDEVKSEVAPTLEFSNLLQSITRVTATNQTDFTKTINRAIELFPDDNSVRHLLFISDADPTAGDSPLQKTLEAVSIARNHQITVSIVGIGLDSTGKHNAEKIVEVGGGKLYAVKNLSEVDKIVLEDYYNLD